MVTVVPGCGGTVAAMAAVVTLLPRYGGTVANDGGLTNHLCIAILCIGKLCIQGGRL